MSKDYINNVINRNKQLVLFIILLFSIFLLIYLNHQFFKERYLIDGYLSLDEVSDIKKNRTEYKNDVDLYIKNWKIPYSYLDKFYLMHIDNVNDYKKIYASNDFKIKVIDKESNYSIDLILYNRKYYKEVKLELTNLPVVSINSTNEINLYGFGKDTYTYNCEYSLRGDSSKESDKKSYNVKLTSHKNNSVSTSLLDMKSNSNWVLNPMYFDNTYVREKISYDIWNNLSSEFNHKLEYVEFIINNTYQGIYYLEEKVNMQTFDGNSKKDLLVSIKDWKYNVDDSLVENANKIYFDSINEFEIEEGLSDNNDLKLHILQSYNQSLNSIDKTNVSIKYDLNNSINYGVFINLTSAIDNTYKNQKIFFRDMKNYYLIQRTVWDLDWTFANENSSRFEYKLSPEFIYDDFAIPDKIRKSDIYVLLTKINYFVFRCKYYNLENLNNIIDKYTNYLTEYGAIDRDSKKWNNTTYGKSLEYLRNYFKERIKVLDKYYGVKYGI